MPTPNPNGYGVTDFEQWASELNEFANEQRQAGMIEMSKLMRQLHREELLARTVRKMSIIALGFASIYGYSPRAVDSMARKQSWSEQYIGTHY